MVVLLLAQFLLGIATNLYVTIPKDHPGTKGGYFAGIGKGIGWALGSGPVPLAIHAALGSALVLVAITVVVLAVRSRARRWIFCGLIGLIAIIAAWFNGVSFYQRRPAQPQLDDHVRRLRCSRSLLRRRVLPRRHTATCGLSHVFGHERDRIER